MPHAYFQSQPSPAEIEARIAGFGAWLEIDLDRLAANLAAIRAHTGAEVMPVVKNNCYGHGLRPMATALWDEGVRWFLVAKTAEALALSGWLPEANVVNMDALYTDAQYREIAERGIVQVVYTGEHVARLAAAAVKTGKRAGVFVKVDTGLHRVGVDYRRAIDLIRDIDEREALEIRGVFTTMMQQDAQDREIFVRYEALMAQMAEAGIDPGMRSVASTHGIFHYGESCYDLVRPAMSLFGVFPMEGDRESGLELSQVLAFRARVEELKPVPAGDNVTYFGTFTAERDMKVGTLHIGFFDGLPRELVNKGTVLVRGRPCPSIGSVSLNHYLFDATEAECEIGEAVTVISRDGPNDLLTTARTAGWMVYSLLNHLSPYLPRVYTRDGVPVALEEWQYG